MQTLHYKDHNIVTPDHPLPRGTSAFTMRSYKDVDFPHGKAKQGGITLEINYYIGCDIPVWDREAGV